MKNVKEISIMMVSMFIVAGIIVSAGIVAANSSKAALECAKSSCPEGWYPWFDGGKCSCVSKAPPIPVPVGESVK